MVRVIVLVAILFGGVALGSVAVRVKTTDPAEISVEPGVYVAFVSAGLLKVPSPAVVQMEETALPPIMPARV
jgi:hypothetical protein